MRTGVITQKVGMTRLFLDDGRHVPVEVALHEMVIRVIGEPGEAHPLDTRVSRQIGGHGPGVGLMALEADGHRLQPLKQLKCAEGREGGSSVAELNRSGAHDEGPLGEIPGEHHIVKRLLGLVEHGETLGVLGPREIPAVDYRPTQRGAMPAHKLR